MCSSARAKPPLRARPAMTWPLGCLAWPPAGYFEMEIVGTTNAATHEVAKCLPSVKVDISTDCKVSLTGYLTGGVVVPMLWSKETTKTYAQFQECPTTSAAAAPSTDDTDPEIKKAIMAALNQFVYGGNKNSDLTTIDITTGIVTVKNTGDVATLVYAIKKVGSPLGRDGSVLLVACSGTRCRELSNAQQCCCQPQDTPPLPPLLPSGLPGHHRHCWCVRHHRQQHWPPCQRLQDCGG